MKKKRIAIFCNRYLGFTLLTAGGVLEDLMEAHDVTIICDPVSKKSISLYVRDRAQVLEYLPQKPTSLSRLADTIAHILSLTYAKAGDRRNLTGILHRQAHLKLSQKKTFLQYVLKKMTVWLSECAEKNVKLRRFLSDLFYLCAPKQKFMNMLKDMEADLALATTAGLGDDGIFFAAARKLNIPTLTLIQSWDRTASKGYPTIRPDHCVVWSEPMAWESIHFLDIPKDRVYVCGAPVWDEYLRESTPLTGEERSAFFKEWSLNPDKKLVFFAINAPSTHGENILLLRQLCEVARDGGLKNIQILFRLHPAYLVEEERSKELKAVFEEYKNPDMHYMAPIVFDTSNKDYIVTDEDRRFMHDMFRACDVTVSIMSTWMIESAIFDKPNICIEYGRYQTGLYDFDLSEYKAEHIARVFSYGSMVRVRSFEALVAAIQKAVANPLALKDNRARIRDLETGPNKGAARKAMIETIQTILGEKSLSV